MNGLRFTCSYHCVGLVDTFTRRFRTWISVGLVLCVLCIHRKQGVLKGQNIATGQF
jgi:hypothetical protein